MTRKQKKFEADMLLDMALCA